MKYLLLFLMIVQNTQADEGPMKILGRGLMDRDTKMAIQLACVDKELECKQLQFVLFKPNGEKHFLASPFLVDLSSEDKTILDQLKNQLPKVQQTLFLKKDENIKRKDHYHLDKTWSENTAVIGTPILGFVLLPKFVVITSYVGAVGFLGVGLVSLFGTRFIWSLVQTFVSPALSPGTLNRVWNQHSQTQSFDSLEETEKLNWQFKPKKMNSLKFKAFLSLLTSDDSLIRSESKTRCAFSGITFKDDKFSNDEVKNWALPMSYAYQFWNRTTHFNKAGFTENDYLNFQISMLRLALDYVPNDPSAPKIVFDHPRTLAANRILRVKLPGCKFANGTDHFKVTNTADTIVSYRKLVSKLLDSSPK